MWKGSDRLDVNLKVMSEYPILDFLVSYTCIIYMYSSIYTKLGTPRLYIYIDSPPPYDLVLYTYVYTFVGVLVCMYSIARRNV